MYPSEMMPIVPQLLSMLSSASSFSNVQPSSTFLANILTTSNLFVKCFKKKTEKWLSFLGQSMAVSIDATESYLLDGVISASQAIVTKKARLVPLAYLLILENNISRYVYLLLEYGASTNSADFCIISTLIFAASSPTFDVKKLIESNVLTLITRKIGEHIESSSLVSVFIISMIFLSISFDIFSISESLRQEIGAFCLSLIHIEHKAEHLARTLLFNARVPFENRIPNISLTNVDNPDLSDVYTVGSSLLSIVSNASPTTRVVVRSPYGHFAFDITSADQNPPESLDPPLEDASPFTTFIPPFVPKSSDRAFEVLYGLGVINAANTNRVEHIGRTPEALLGFDNIDGPTEIYVKLIDAANDFSSESFAVFLNAIADANSGSDFVHRMPFAEVRYALNSDARSAPVTVVFDETGVPPFVPGAVFGCDVAIGVGPVRDGLYGVRLLAGDAITPFVEGTPLLVRTERLGAMLGAASLCVCAHRQPDMFTAATMRKIAFVESIDPQEQTALQLIERLIAELPEAPQQLVM